MVSQWFAVTIGIINLGIMFCLDSNASNVAVNELKPLDMGQVKCEMVIKKPKILSRGITSGITVTVTEEDLDHNAIPVIHQQNSSVRMLITPGYERQFTADVLSSILGWGRYEVCVESCGCKVFDIFTIPAPLTILPPLLTVVLAIITRQVLVSLTFGIYTAAFIASAYNPLEALFMTFNDYLIAPFLNPGKASVLLFVALMAGLVEITEKSGGAAGLANLIFKLAKTAHHASIVTVILQLMFFFDGFASIIISSKSLGPLVGQLGLSVQKFSFIVHVMSVAVPSICPLSSWAGIQIGYIESAFKLVNRDVSGFSYLLQTIPYRFFVVSAILCTFIYVCLNRDIPPTIHFEESSNSNHRQRTVSSASIAENYNLETHNDEPLLPLRWYNAVLPLLILISITVTRMYFDGRSVIIEKELGISLTFVNCVSNSDSINDLNIGSAVSLIFVLILIPLQRLIPVSKCLEHFVEGAKSSSEPVIILILAWALGIAMSDVHTSDYIALALGDNMPTRYMPALVCVIGYVMSYSSGCSLGTQGIVFPLVIPVAVNLTRDHTIHVRIIAATLGSSVFGNLCSPIADTTIGSVIFTGCPLIDHIKVITTFAAPVALLSLIFGDLLVGMDIYPFYVTYIIVAVVFSSAMLFTGREPGKKSVFSKLVDSFSKFKAKKFSVNDDSVSSESLLLLPKSFTTKP